MTVENIKSIKALNKETSQREDALQLILSDGKTIKGKKASNNFKIISGYPMELMKKYLEHRKKTNADKSRGLFLSVSAGWYAWSKKENRHQMPEPKWYANQNMGKTMIEDAVRLIVSTKGLSTKFMRQYSATSLLQNGRSREEVAVYTGHSNPNNLSHYQNNSPQYVATQSMVDFKDLCMPSEQIQQEKRDMSLVIDDIKTCNVPIDPLLDENQPKKLELQQNELLKYPSTIQSSGNTFYITGNVTFVLSSLDQINLPSNTSKNEVNLNSTKNHVEKAAVYDKSSQDNTVLQEDPNVSNYI